jgi:hypothetical protein
MLSKFIAALIVGLYSDNISPSKIFIPTSAALDVAEKVAIGEGYHLNQKKMFFFDIMFNEDNTPVFPGYITVGFYWNSDIVSAISIDQETGQILDIDKCVVFDFPNIRNFQKEISAGTGVRALSMNELGRKVGCEALKRLSVPKKAP